jgi:hypothetical protein
MIELLKQWSELEPEKCSPAEAGSVFRLSYNLQNGHYIDSNNLSNEILAIIQRCVQNAIIARNWPFDLAFGSSGYKAWIQAKFGNPAYAVSTDIVECLLAAYITALKLARPRVDELIQTVYVARNDELECQCIHGCRVLFVIVPYVATPKAIGECEHFRYVMLLDEDSQNER